MSNEHPHRGRNAPTVAPVAEHGAKQSYTVKLMQTRLDVRGTDEVWEKASTRVNAKYRPPTVFELISLHKESRLPPLSWYWSISPDAKEACNAWAVSTPEIEDADLYFSDAGLHSLDKWLFNTVFLVEADTDFKYETPVAVEEIAMYVRTGELPDWHPPFKIESNLPAKRRLASKASYTRLGDLT